MKKAILVGYGEIGKAVKEVFKNDIDIDVCDLKFMEHEYYDESYDLMFVAFPYDDDFVHNVGLYEHRFKPQGTIIFSTIQIGTIDKLSKFMDVVHSPVEGKHPDLADSIRFMTRWVGGIDSTTSLEIMMFFANSGLDLRLVIDAKATEFLKLSSTSLYGVNIEFARYRKSVCDSLGIDYNLVKEFDKDYNELYKKLGLEQYQRYILDPPKGIISGHCVVPNAKILDKLFPSELLKRIFRR